MRSTFEYIEYINRIRNPVRAGGHALWASAFAQNPNYKRTESQEEFYERNKATEEIMTFVRTSNKAFGEKHMEGFARDFFRFKKKK